ALPAADAPLAHRLYLRPGRTGARRRGAAAHEAGAARHPRAADLFGCAGLVALARHRAVLAFARARSHRLVCRAGRRARPAHAVAQTLARPGLVFGSLLVLQRRRPGARAAAPAPCRARPHSQPHPARTAAGAGTPPRALRMNRGRRFIYIACPWTPVGGGMFKVADYLIQSQASDPGAHAARLRPLDTRGGGHAVSSLWVLLTALARLVWGRLQGRLAGVHVNMAERLSLLRKSVIVVMCRALGVPVVLHLHAAQLHHFYRALPAPLRALTRWVFSLPASVVVLGTSARCFVTEELHVPAHRVEIVINGVPAPVERRRQSGPDGTQR